MIDLEILELQSPAAIQMKIAGNIRRLRKRRRISQQKLAALSGVSFASIRRFEKQGDISLSSLAKIALALEVEQEMAGLFSDVPYLSIDEVLHEPQ